MQMRISHLLVAFAGITQCAPVEVTEFSKRLNNGVGVTPAMGFNNWNAGLRKLLNTPPLSFKC
jgi:alpha-galactosidase